VHQIQADKVQHNIQTYETQIQNFLARWMPALARSKQPITWGWKGQSNLQLWRTPRFRAKTFF